MGAAVLLLMLAMEDPPKDVVDFFRSAAVELSEAHDNGGGRAFLDHFDKSMPGFNVLSDQIEAMVAAGEVSTTIEFVNTEGNDRKRTLDLDWLLQCEGERPKRQVVKCTIEKRGKKWKITSLAPIEFFKRE
jgi:hypothetical protein